MSSAAAAGAALVAWLWFATPALADDGPQIVQEFARPDGLALWFHALYFPAADALAMLGVRSDRALSLLSALAGAVLVGTAHASAFVVAGDRRAAATAAIAVATAPAVACHATYIEVHALHGATVGAVVLALLLLRRWPRRVLLVTFAGAALAALTHRSAALLVPPLAAVAAACLQQAGARSHWRALLAAAAGVVCGHAGDELAHRWLGGPGLVASFEHVRAAAATPWPTQFAEELLLPLGLLWFAAAGPWTARAAGELRWAPLLALAAYGVPIAAAGVPTHGGYWLGAVPFLALGLAIQLPAWLAKGTFARVLTAAALVLSAWLAVRAVLTPARAVHAELRERRIAAASVWLPDGGTLLSTCPGMQYVDGAVPRVREIDLCSFLGYRVLAGIAQEQVLADVMQLVATETRRDAVVLWSSEWRDVREMPPEFAAVLASIEARVVAEHRGVATTTPFGRVWCLKPR